MSTATPWQALGAQLAVARSRTAPSQQALARHVGISQAAYSHFERGRLRPRPARLVHLAVALGADITQLAALAGYSLAQVLGTTAPSGQVVSCRAPAAHGHHEGGSLLACTCPSR
jgi:transcriptional regulator with XRE-family HTH domain